MLLVQWGDSTEAEDFDRLVRTVADARGSAEQEIAYVAIIPRGNPLPDRSARVRIARAIDEVSDHCASIHIVIEGEGMRRALVRSVMAGLRLVIRKRSRRFSVHGDVGEALAAAATSVAFDPAAVLAQAERAGVLGERPQPSRA